MADYVLVLTTLGAAENAEALASTLIEERLAACVNILPAMVSVYRWRGSIERESERQLVVKTSRDRLDVLRERLIALHPYELPELLVVEIAGGSEAYLDWVRASTRPAG